MASKNRRPCTGCGPGSMIGFFLQGNSILPSPFGVGCARCQMKGWTSTRKRRQSLDRQLGEAMDAANESWRTHPDYAHLGPRES